MRFELLVKRVVNLLRHSTRTCFKHRSRTIRYEEFANSAPSGTLVSSSVQQILSPTVSCAATQNSAGPSGRPGLGSREPSASKPRPEGPPGEGSQHWTEHAGRGPDWSSTDTTGPHCLTSHTVQTCPHSVTQNFPKHGVCARVAQWQDIREAAWLRPKIFEPKEPRPVWNRNGELGVSVRRGRNAARQEPSARLAFVRNRQSFTLVLTHSNVCFNTYGVYPTDLTSASVFVQQKESMDSNRVLLHSSICIVSS